MNLLNDPVFRVRWRGGGEGRLSLPGLMAAFGGDDVAYLVGIQRHQEDAFHVFLSYLAGAVLARSGRDDPVQGEGFWREGLRGLASHYGPAGPPGGESGNGGINPDDGWSLIVDDLSRPAFMQPPLPEGDGAPLRPVEPAAHAPDALDLLQTAKNHDVKQARTIRPEADEWVYALVSLQTMSGFMGQGNYGISRMNSGSGNRSIVELTRTLEPGGRWRDAAARLLRHREGVLGQEYGFDPDGLVLVWLQPWDGRESIPLTALDPLYVEICRRVRLGASDAGTIEARTARAWAPRIAARDLKGVVGDPWLPIDTGSRGDSADYKALTPSARGLTSDVMRRIVFGRRIILSPLQQPSPDWDGPMWMTASVLVRGQGTTDGFHQRRILIPPKAKRRLWGPPEEREPLAALARTAVERAADMRLRVLRPALFALFQGGPDTVKYDKDSAVAWWDRFSHQFEALWSADYFPWLWSHSEQLDESGALAGWARKLRDHALTVLGHAQRAMPVREGRRYRTLVQSDRYFWGALNRNFPELKRGEDVAT